MGNLHDLGSRIKTRWRASEARYSGAYKWCYQSVQVGGTDEPSPQSKCSSNLENQKGTSPVFFTGGQCFASQVSPHGGQGAVSPVTPVGLSAPFGTSTPQWTSTPSPQLAQSAPLLTNNAVMLDPFVRHAPPFARRALRLAPFVTRSFPRSTKFCGGSFRR